MTASERDVLHIHIIPTDGASAEPAAPSTAVGDQGEGLVAALACLFVIGLFILTGFLISQGYALAAVACIMIMVILAVLGWCAKGHTEGDVIE